ADDSKLLGRDASVVCPAVSRTTWNAKRLPRPHRDVDAINSPGERTLQAIHQLFVTVIAVCRARDFKVRRRRKFENGHGAVAVSRSKQETNFEARIFEELFRHIDADLSRVTRHDSLRKVKIYISRSSRTVIATHYPRKTITVLITSALRPQLYRSAGC